MTVLQNEKASLLMMIYDAGHIVSNCKIRIKIKWTKLRKHLTRRILLYKNEP